MVIYYSYSYYSEEKHKMKFDQLGKNIRAVRRKRRMSQETLSEAAGLSPTYLGCIERGEKTPSLESFINIANALNVSADVLLYDQLKSGYEVKSSLLTERIEKLSEGDQKMIYDVVETLIKYSRQVRP